MRAAKAQVEKAAEVTAAASPPRTSVMRMDKWLDTVCVFQRECGDLLGADDIRSLVRGWRKCKHMHAHKSTFTLPPEILTHLLCSLGPF